ncbi:MAG: hypothetical protein Kow00129_09760 [Thermoleophilia bacterium]
MTYSAVGPIRRRGATPAAVVLLALFVAVALLLAGQPATAWAQSDSGLTPEQEALAQSIERELIAPCCWTQTVADHDSNAADEIKVGIRTMIASGASKEEIIDFYKERYGAEILAAPEKSGFNLMAYVVPAITVMGALAVLLVMLRRWREREDRAAVPASVAPAVRERGRPDLDERLQKELQEFDD